MGKEWVSLRYGTVAHISLLSLLCPTLTTLPYSALPCVIIPANNLQAPVKCTINVLAVTCQYFIVKSTGFLFTVADVIVSRKFLEHKLMKRLCNAFD